MPKVIQTPRHTHRVPEQPFGPWNLRFRKKPTAKMQHLGSQSENVEPSLPAMGGFINGPQIKPLHQSGEYDPKVIAKYIATVLHQIRRQDSYGILVSVQVGGGALVPTLVFGFPGDPVPEAALHPTPYDLPLSLLVDSIVFINEFDTVWAGKPICDVGQLTLEELSVGIEGSTLRAGSFGGFLRLITSPSEVFGITAAHCVQGAVPGAQVCSPSTVEITSRFDRIIPYTSLSPPEKRFHLNVTKESEALSILNRFRFQPQSSGTTFLDPASNAEPTTGIFSGAEIGQIVSIQYGNRSGVLYDYDERLKILDLPTFSARRSLKTRLDWCIFSCHPHRYGGNRYESSTITKTGELYPGAIVEKVGRTTGIQFGKVNGLTLQRWDTGHITHDIAIIGDSGLFAHTGDSGSCVLVREGKELKAAGILIAKNLLTTFALATPLNVILKCAHDFEWAKPEL